MSNALLNPIQIGPYSLANRVFMAPLTRSRSPENVATALNKTYYQQRATAGLIISEGTQISRQGTGYPYTMGIYTESQIEQWKHVTQAVHDKGGRIFCQLWHEGRMSLPAYHNGELPVSASATNPRQTLMNPQGELEDTVAARALSFDEIQAIIQDYAIAAKNAITAGFDGVEVHSANGYLLHQFFVNCTNQRTDSYGGSIENKARILFEVLDAVTKAIGAEKVGLRLNPSMHNLFGITLDKETIPTFEYIVRRLNDYPDLAFLHLTEPMAPVDDISYAVQHIAVHFRPLYQGTLVSNCGFNAQTGHQIIADGHADAVAFGKAFISNPDLVERIRQGAPWAAWDESTFYGGNEKGYTDYPTMTTNTANLGEPVLDAV